MDNEAPKKRANNKIVEGFDYIRGVGVRMTVTEWRAVAATHNCEVKNGETFFRGRITKRLEFEAYAKIC